MSIDVQTLVVLLFVFVAVLVVAVIWLALSLLRAKRELSTVLIEGASLQERSRLMGLDCDNLNASVAAGATEIRRLHDALDLSRDESAKLLERSSRLADLERKYEEIEASLGVNATAATSLKESLARLEAELAAEKSISLERFTDLQQERIVRQRAEVDAAEKTTNIAELNTRLDLQERQSIDKLELLGRAEAELSARFKNLANEILEEKSKRFVEQNQSNLSQLLGPLGIKISEFQAKVEDVYVKESKDRTALGEQVRQLLSLNHALSQDAKNLTLALKGSNKAQGNWGELVLERILEDAGLRKGFEYDAQQSHVGDDGERSLPDVVIHLPEGRHLVIDSKVSLIAYEQYVSLEDEEQKRDALKRHVESVRTHIKGLSEKNYQRLHGLDSLDFVLMFLPIESAYVAAASNDAEMLMDAFKRNVLLVSPFTLLFVVRIVAQLWRQEAQSRNAQQIASRGAELYDRLVAFVTDLEKVGDRLRLAQESFTTARDKLSRNKGNVIRQAEMLRELGVKPTKGLPPSLLDDAEGDSSQLPVQDND